MPVPTPRGSPNTISGRVIQRFSQITVILLVINVVSAAGAQAPKYDVLTHHNDIYRSGVYSSEMILRPANVNSKSFGKIFARRVLGQIWGQPLYVRGVPVKGRLRNVVYVATSENWVYGFDADDRTPDETTKPLMSAFLGKPAMIDEDNFHTIFPSNGISGTPAIDLGNPPNPSKGTLYVVAKLAGDKKFHIFALDLSSLAIRRNVVVSGEAPGQDASGHILKISFDDPDSDSDSNHLNRPALLISNNYLIVAFGSGPPKNDWDASKYHGWVMSYSLPDLVRTGVFITTPSTDTGMGGIWQSGNGPAADDQGDVYFMTGNGKFQSTRALPDLADAFVKLDNHDGTLHLKAWYSPPSREVLQACDLDLGTSGPAVLQDAGKVLGAGKSGILYVLDKDKENLGETETTLTDADDWRGTPDCANKKCIRVAENQYEPPAKTKLACSMKGANGSDTGFNTEDSDHLNSWNKVLDSYPHVHGAPVVWNLGNGSSNLYVWPEQDFLKAYRFNGQSFSPNPVGSSAPVTAARMSMPGGVLSLSWNGANTETGILWAARPDPDARQYAVGTPFVSVFNDVLPNGDGFYEDQQHFVFRNKEGAIWDSFYNRTENQWRFQQVNFSGIPAAGGVFVSVFGSADQQHFAYTDALGNIWDSFYRHSDDKWFFQPIASNGHTPVGGIFVSAFHDQQHFVWRDGSGSIWDSYYRQHDGGWDFQPIHTNGHPAAGNVFVSVFDSADQQHFVYTDSAGNIWDSFYIRGDDNPWHFQQIDTHGHTPVGGIFVSAFHDQQHFAWRDGSGSIWDSYYVQGDGWHFQPIHTNGHPVAGGIFVSVFDSADQQHFAYTDAVGNIWDSFYRRSDDKWLFQPITTNGHAPVGGIFVSAFHDQQHFVWRDGAGSIWDSYYVQEHGWHFQRINNTIDCMSSSGSDLTPNDAPCNAINKTVRGYLEAFDATPGPNGRLKELWNSKANRNDGVWFAKQSPPTIADGKAFLVEFPPPIPGRDWSDSKAFGRLVVYTLR